MSAAQIPGTPQGAEGGQPPSQVSEQPQADPMDAARAEALLALKDERDGDTDATLDSKPDANKKPDASQPGAQDRAVRVETIKKALEGLSDQEASELLGAHNDAFASLTHKRQKVAQREESLVREEQRIKQDRADYDDEQKEWGEALAQGRKDPNFALELFGWDAESVKAWAETGKAPPEHELKGKLSEAEKRLEDLEKRRQESEERAKGAEAQAKVDAWHRNVHAAIGQVDSEKHPLIIRWAEGAKSEGVDARDALFNDIVAVQQAAMAGNLRGLRGETVPPGTIVDSALAVRYIEGRLALQRKRLVGDENPNPAQAGTVKSAEPEGSKKTETPNPPPNGGGQVEDTMVAARAEAIRLLQEERAS